MFYLGGSGGSSGAPFPLLGEIYFFFGWLGIVLAIPAGATSSWLFSRFQRSLISPDHRTLLWCLLYMGCILSMLMGMHDGLRTVTRYPIWVVAWYYSFTGLSSFLKGAGSQYASLPA
jgi:hypothetical protein